MERDGVFRVKTLNHLDISIHALRMERDWRNR